MTYNVFNGTLNPAQSIILCVQIMNAVHVRNMLIAY